MVQELCRAMTGESAAEGQLGKLLVIGSTAAQRTAFVSRLDDRDSTGVRLRTLKAKEMCTAAACKERFTDSRRPRLQATDCFWTTNTILQQFQLYLGTSERRPYQHTVAQTV